MTLNSIVVTIALATLMYCTFVLVTMPNHLGFDLW